MKSRIDDSLERMPKLSPKEIKQALKWIDNLTTAELAKFELMARVQLAQILVKYFLKRKTRLTLKKARRKSK